MRHNDHGTTRLSTEIDRLHDRINNEYRVFSAGSVRNWSKFGLIGAALFFSRRFKEAIPRLRVAIEETPVFQTPYRFLAACYAHGGLLDEARATIARLRAIASEVMVNYPLPFRDPQHRELYFSGLRLAMGETT
jgi:hypothetical protein